MTIHQENLRRCADVCRQRARAARHAIGNTERNQGDYNTVAAAHEAAADLYEEWARKYLW